MSTFIVIGKNFKGLHNSIIEHGHDYIELLDVAKTKHFKSNNSDQFFGDFSSIDSLLKTLDKNLAGRQIDGVLVVYENYVLPAAHIAKHLGLPGLPIESAEACTDKYKMRQLFSKAKRKISPDFEIVSSEQDVLDFAKKHSYPLILKPANLAKSLLVTKNNDEAELIANYHRTMANIDEIYQKYAPNRQPKIIIEEFMEGKVFSVDAFVDIHGKPYVLNQVVDYQTGYDVGFDDNFHYSRLLPSHLPDETIKEIREVAAEGCRALGMKNSPAHIEIILTKEGPQIVEIGARNGGYRDRMHKLANDIDITGNLFKLALGQEPKIDAKRNDPCAVLELFPKEPGVFQSLNNLDELKQLPSLVYVSVKANIGDFVGKSAEGHKMCAVVILHNKDVEQFNRDLSFVNNEVYVKTKN